METSHPGWWRRHGLTIALLLTAFGISFAIRTIWAYPVIAQWGPLFTYAGGSDSYYHSRVTTFIIENHRNLIFDPLLNFPIGAINPREPLFDWMNAILGIVFAPFFGGNAVVAGAWFLDLQAPLWAALGVFPVYLIGREVSGRRMGLIAALIFPFLSANIDSSTFGYANYLSFYTFIILVVVYSYIRTVKAVGNRRWIENYRNPRSYLPGLRGFLRTERTAVKWAVFTGVSLGALALAWQGYTYAVVVIGVSVLIAMIAERIRRVDSFGLYVATWIVGLVGFPMAMPYYLAQHQFAVWFDLPLLLYFGILALLLPFLLLRDVPWVFSVPLLGLLVAAAAGVLAIVNPAYFTSIVTGQGYFVKSLIYSTVAEAQAPSIDSLVIGYGVVTFFLAFAGLAIFIYLLVHGRFKRYHVVFLVFAVLSIYLPISAEKFFLLGSPIFALLPAEALRRALDLAAYPELRRTVASLSDRRSQFAAFRRAFKARHVLVMVLVIGLILPNVWVAIDAGIPGNTKGQASLQVASTLPSWLQLNSSDPTGYFGAAGSSLDTPNQYDSAGYNWLAQQDTNIPVAQRPAFISWWDYGFQAIDQGNHPSVADNFQDGIDPSGQFLLSQNESQAIAVLTTTLLQAEQKKTGSLSLPESLNTILARDGLNVGQLNSLLVNQSSDYSLVVAHPERYLPVDPSTLTDANAMYLAVEYFIAVSLPLSQVAKVYNDVQQYTGWSIRYAMVDSRLFPFSGTDTGIFYAPADLTGRLVDSAGMPTTFFNVFVNGSDGNTYPAGQVPAGVSPVSYSIAYYAPFYNSMIYRTYIGYNGTDIGEGAGIPGLAGSQAVIDSPLMPGWMLQHFEIVYKTAYYCPQNNASDGAACFYATNTPTALALQKKSGGSVDTSAGSYFNAGETMLEYYPGQTFLGDVVLPDGTPVAGARVTVDDGWGIPHMTTLTASDGTFSVVLPPGNDTVNITVGTFNPLRQQDAVQLKSLPITVSNAMGLSLNAPAIVQTVTVSPTTAQGFVYWNANNTSGYYPAQDPLIPGAQVILWGGGAARVTATTDASGSFYLPNLPPGVYNYSILYAGRNYTQSPVTLSPGTPYNATVGLLPGVFRGVVSDTSGVPVANATVTLGNTTGIVASNLTNASGAYLIRSVGAGTYTLTAQGTATDVRSEGVSVTASNPGAIVQTNLTVRPTSTVTVTVTSNGTPVAGIPVRFVPVAVYGNRTPIGSLQNASENSSVVTTGSDGRATAALPEGTYSVYGLGYVGTSVEAGVGSISVLATGTALSIALGLSPAVRLSGNVASTGPTTNTSGTAVIAYASTGGEVIAWTGANGGYSLLLPPGGYSVLALSGPTQGSPSTLLSALAAVSLSGPTTLSLTPVSALYSQFTVGSTLPNGALLPAEAAVVTVSAGTYGPAVPAVASATGIVTYYLPSVLSGIGPTYCVRSTALGFAPATECGIPPSGLSALTQFPLTLENVAVTLTVVGLPSGTSLIVNLTAESPSAVNRTLTGGPVFSFSAPPGAYGVGAWASLANGTLYLPPSILSTTVPLGATYTNLTLYLLPWVASKGSLTLPAGASASAVNVTLTSPQLTLTVNGTHFTKGFRAAPGTYSAYTNVTVANVTYANLTRLTVSPSGAVSPAIALASTGLKLGGQLTNPSGAAVSLNATVTLTGPTGAVAQANALNGRFSVVLPAGIPYRLQANATALTVGPNGSYFQTWTSAPGASCTPTTSAPTCALEMVPTTELLWLNGTLTSPGITGPVGGEVRLVGPYPSDGVTLLTVPTGTFSVRVLPGAYSVYANATSLGSLRAAFASTVVLPSSAGPLSLSLTPTRSVTISLVPPNATSVGLGSVTLTLRDSSGNRLIYTGLRGTSSVTVALPLGSYSVSAVAPGTSYGVATNASASARFTVANGNVGVLLTLTYVPQYRVAASLTGPTSATVAGGGVATFAFALRNSGNVPVTVTPVGTPAYWTFAFSLGPVTLSPGGPNVSGEVRILVPAGTPVSHPTVSLEFQLANGTVIGSVAPVVNVVAYYGIGTGAPTAPVQVAPHQFVVPFYVVNTGNTFESAALSIVDAPRLEGLGWSPIILNSSRAVTPIAHLNAGANETYFAYLNATGPAFIAPGTITVSASVLDANGSVQATAVLPVSLATVEAKSPSGAPLVGVSGPGLGTAPFTLPDWLIAILAFLPAIALAVGVATYRWWRTRRWNRR